jgi:hypothetical protein
LRVGTGVCRCDGSAVEHDFDLALESAFQADLEHTLPGHEPEAATAVAVALMLAAGLRHESSNRFSMRRIRSMIWSSWT